MVRDAALYTALKGDGLPVANVAAGVPAWSRAVTAPEQQRADAILARFAGQGPVLDADLAADLQSEAEIDAMSDAVLDLILAAKVLPPNATAADVRARAKADRRARGGRP